MCIRDRVNKDSVWFTGPRFLYTVPESWPVSRVNENKLTQELKSGCKAHTVANVNTVNVANFGEVLHIEDYSSLYRLFRVVAHVLRFKYNLLARLCNREKRMVLFPLMSIKWLRNLFLNMNNP